MPHAKGIYGQDHRPANKTAAATPLGVAAAVPSATSVRDRLLGAHTGQ